ncbi:hypothetical protein [Bosea sp. (in: a-proteobacteria)]|uniref:hypothetical protein n=1 Tax=Bosea sp. (in: a-proteobacteria) TaxID=1871050 RepID=UPI004034327F
MLEAVHERLAGVWIDCLGFEAFIQRWDRPKTLFYLDPPDWGTEPCFGRGLFEQSDFERLSAALQRLQGRFILSLNDVPGGPRVVRLGVDRDGRCELPGGRGGPDEKGLGGGD